MHVDAALLSSWGGSKDTNDGVVRPVGACHRPAVRVFVQRWGHVRVNVDDAHCEASARQGEPGDAAFGRHACMQQNDCFPFILIG